MSTDQDPMNAATVALKNLLAWMRERVVPAAQAAHPAELKRWQQEVHSIGQSIVRPRAVQVALVGTTGAGKSTLLNSLLGVQLLQVGVAQSITSFVTRVRHSDGIGYHIEIEYAPDGHLKFPHLWPPKFPRARRADYGLGEALRERLGPDASAQHLAGRRPRSRVKGGWPWPPGEANP